MQWYTIAMMLLSGVGMGVVFDGYRVVSNELRFPRWTLPMLDMTYWLAASILVFKMLYASNNGEVRAYVFLGLVIGIFSYYWLFSKPIIAMVQWLIHAIRMFLRFMRKVFIILIVKPIMLLYKILIVVLGFGSALTIFVFKTVLQLVRPFWLLLRWLLGPLFRLLRQWLGPYVIRWQLHDKWNLIASRMASLWRRWF